MEAAGRPGCDVELANLERVVAAALAAKSIGRLQDIQRDGEARGQPTGYGENDNPRNGEISLKDVDFDTSAETLRAQC